MQDIYYVLIDAIVIFIVLFFLTKILGKKQIAQLTLFDYIIGITIGTIAGSTILDLSIPLYVGVVALIVFCILGLGVSMLTLKSTKLSKFFIGQPVVLIQDGKIIFKNLKKVRLSIESLLSLCREYGCYDISYVLFAVLETNGKLSLLYKDEYQPINMKDLKLKSKKEKFCPTLILDGEILNDNLKLINKNKKWLENEIKKQNVKKISKVLLGILSSDGKLKIFTKENIKEKNVLN